MPLKNFIFALLVLVGGALSVHAEDIDSLKALKADELTLRKEAYALRQKYEEAAQSGDVAKADVLKAEWLAFRKKTSDEIKAKRDQWVKENPAEARKMMERHKQLVKDHPEASQQTKASPVQQ